MLRQFSSVARASCNSALPIQLDWFCAVEQIAVEIGDVVNSERPAHAHLGEEIAHSQIEARRVDGVSFDDSGEQAFGQQIGVFGVEAERQLIEIARHPLVVNILAFHIFGDFGEQAGGFFA